MGKFVFLSSILQEKINSMSWWVPPPPLLPITPTSYPLLIIFKEKAEERWRPILSVEAIIVSVVSMLSNPNDESPANIDAAVWYNLPMLLPLTVGSYIGFVEEW